MSSTDHPLSCSVHSRLREFHLRRLMADRRGGTLLDVGCGLGYLTEALGQGFFCVGLESDPGSLALDKARGLANMVRGSASALPFQPDSIDAIICSEVLEHLPDGIDEEALRELCRVLKPGGRLYITVPSLEGLRATTAMRNLGHGDPGSGEYHHRMGYSWADMDGMLERVPGLRIVRKTHSMFLASELFMDLLKWVYLRKNKLKEHSDLAGVKTSLLFRVYRRVFPLLHLFFLAEDLLLCGLFGGHILILSLEKTGGAPPGGADMASFLTTILKNYSLGQAARAELEEDIGFLVRSLPGIGGFLIRWLAYKPLFKSIASVPYIYPGVRFVFMGNITLGKGSLINSNCYVYGRGGIDIGDHVLISPNCSIVAGDHDLSRGLPMIERASKAEKIVIEEDSWIGANTVVCGGVTIAKGSVIGAGAVVTRDTEPYSINVGVPARKVGERK